MSLTKYGKLLQKLYKNKKCKHNKEIVQFMDEKPLCMECFKELK